MLIADRSLHKIVRSSLIAGDSVMSYIETSYAQSLNSFLRLVRKSLNKFFDRLHQTGFLKHADLKSDES